MSEELNRKYDTVNMLITMHSILHCKFRSLEKTSKITFLLFAIILNVFTFMDFDRIHFITMSESNIGTTISIVSFFVFLLSVIYLLIEWQKKSERHRFAMDQLSKLLNEIREISRKGNEITNSERELINEHYNQTFESITVIPNSKFNRLKAKHYRKLELSKFINNHKGKPYFVIKFLFYRTVIFSYHDKK